MIVRNLLIANKLLADRVRLAIMATLAAAKDPLDFTSLLETLELSRGNLSSHMRKLEDAKYVQVHKEFKDRRPRTTYTCTDLGLRELASYLEGLESFLRGVKGGMNSGSDDDRESNK
jgi:DNA-binding transcriptional ArsR family regulator